MYMLGVQNRYLNHAPDTANILSGVVFQGLQVVFPDGSGSPNRTCRPRKIDRSSTIIQRGNLCCSTYIQMRLRQTGRMGYLFSGHSSPYILALALALKLS